MLAWMRARFLGRWLLDVGLDCFGVVCFSLVCLSLVHVLSVDAVAAPGGKIHTVIRTRAPMYRGKTETGEYVSTTRLMCARAVARMHAQE